MNSLFMRRFSVRALDGLVPIVTAVLTMACHNSPPLTDGYPLQESLKKKSKDEILLCAGPAVREWTDGDFTMLRHYPEAHILEESMVSSKASRPTAHHGCWATVTIRHEQIERVHYRFVPPLSTHPMIAKRSLLAAKNDSPSTLRLCARLLRTHN